MEKNPDPDPGSEMKIPDHLSKSLERVFWVKIHKFFDADPDPGSFRPWIRDPGWKNSDRDPQHCFLQSIPLRQPIGKRKLVTLIRFARYKQSFKEFLL